MTEGINQTSLKMDLDWLAPGKYIVNLSAYSVNEYGSNQLHDVVEDCFAFEKLQGDSNNRMVWNHTYWGYIMFPELTIEE